MTDQEQAKAQVETLQEAQEMQDKLQSEFEAAQAALGNARAEYTQAKQRLVDFNSRYGRVLQMIREDE